MSIPHPLQAIKALTAALAPKTRVMRDGSLQQMDASQLVPGDIVLIAIGNIVPADLKLLGEEGDDVPMQVRTLTVTLGALLLGPLKEGSGGISRMTHVSLCSYCVVEVPG